MKYKWVEPDVGEEEAEAVKEAVHSGWIGGNGPQSKKLEELFKEHTGAKYALAVNNGTSGLLCAFQAIREVKYPMRFIVPTLTFFATGATAYEMGEKISFVDCDKTWNIKTNLDNYSGMPIVIPVDVCGLPAEYDKLKKYDKIIIADSAESLGSLYKGQPIGTQALIHVFSLHVSKVITTGEGGMITTNNKELYETMKSVRNQGYVSPAWYEYKHERIGFNYRMSELNAALGVVQMKKLQRYVKERQEKARIYKDIIGDLVEYQEIPKHCTPNYFLFGILVGNNVKFCQELAKKGVGSKCLFTPLHLQKPFKTSIHLRNAEYIGRHGLSIPIHNKITEEDAKEIASIVREVAKNG